MTVETRAPDRQVPFDESAEQQVLGSLLIDRDAIFKVADLLRVDDFYIARHQRIYDAAQALLERRERIDPLTIQIDRKSTRLNSSHVAISYAVFCLKKK